MIRIAEPEWSVATKGQSRNKGWSKKKSI